MSIHRVSKLIQGWLAKSCGGWEGSKGSIREADLQTAPHAEMCTLARVPFFRVSVLIVLSLEESSMHLHSCRMVFAEPDFHPPPAARNPRMLPHAFWGNA